MSDAYGDAYGDGSTLVPVVVTAESHTVIETVAAVLAPQLPAWAPVHHSSHESLVSSLDIPKDARHAVLLNAFQQTDRSKYAPPPSSNPPRNANYPSTPFSNSPQPLPSKQTISSPSTHLQTLITLLPFPPPPAHNHTILDVGCGSGILCALLHRSSPSSKILGIDHFPNLSALSKSNLQSDGIPLSEHLKPGHVTIKNINYHSLPSLLSSFKILGFDMIAFGCSPSSIPAGIVDVLLEGGRCVVPVGTRMKQRYTLLTKCRDVGR